MASGKEATMAANKFFLDLQDAILELVNAYKQSKCPITDDNTTFHRFCNTFEYLLHSGLKEKYNILGCCNSYWEYFCKCLASQRRIHDGLRFVKSLKEFKTSLGRGRAFIRFCLVHRCIAHAIQQCSLNEKVTSYFYDDTSILRQKSVAEVLVENLYKLHEIEFDISAQGYDLDVSWPTTDRRIEKMAHCWKLPSRSTSMTSLNSISGNSDFATSGADCYERSASAVPDAESLVGWQADESGEIEPSFNSDQREVNQSDYDIGVGDTECSVHKNNEPEGEVRNVVSEYEETVEALRAENELLLLQLGVHEQRSRTLEAECGKMTELEAAVKKTADENAALNSALEKFREMLATVAKMELQIQISHKERPTYANLEGDEEIFTVAGDAINRMKSMVRENEEDTRGIAKEKTEEELERERILAEKLDEARAVVARLKVAHGKLHTSEAILRYELSEKRTLLGRLRKQLESTREQWMRIRRQNAEAEEEWKSLRAEFASRAKQKSEESGFSDEATDSSANMNSNEEYRTTSPSVASSFGPQTEDGTATACGLDKDEESAEDDGESRHNRRLKFLEEQCRLLYSKLLASRKKSEILEWRLAQLHEHYGPEENPEQVEEENLAQDEEQKAEVSEECECCEEMEEEEMAEGGEFFECEAARSSDLDEGVSEEVEEEARDMEECGGMEVDDGDEKGVGEVEQTQLFMARSLPKRVEKLRLEKEEMHAELRKIEMERKVSDAREAELLSQVNIQKEEIMELEERLRAVEEERQALLQREVEFKKRADFIMRKERDDKESRFRTFVTRNLQLQSQVESLEHSLNVKLSCVEELEETLRQSRQEMADNATALENEVQSLKLQLTVETARCQQAISRHGEHSAELIGMRETVSEQERLIFNLEQELVEIRQNREEEKMQLEELNLCLTTREEECTVLNGGLREAVRSLDGERQTARRIQRELDYYKSENTKLKLELTQLYSDSSELKSRIIKLIRDKDMLWKRSEKLSFIQKVNATDRWMSDDEVSHCLGCKAEFTLVLRRHHCRLCGRIFCSDCCSNWALTTASSRRVRVCSECTIRHSQSCYECDSPDLTLEGDEGDVRASNSAMSDETSTSSSAGSDSSTSEARTLAVPIPSNTPSIDTRPSSRDSASGASAQRFFSSLRLPFEHETASNAIGGTCILNRLFGNKGSPLQTMIFPNDDEFCLITDEEIIRSLSPYSPYAPSQQCVDNSVNLAATKTLEEMEVEFASGNFREVWINAGKTYGVPILIEDTKSSVVWEFTTEPKSIAFMLEFRSTQGPEGVANSAPQVLVPITRCDSHLQSIRGKLLAKKMGIYTFMFNNSFSRFTPKKLNFKVQVLKRTESKGCDESPVSFS